MMNIGFYIKNLSDNEQMEFISKIVNQSVEENLVSDASIFYDGVGFVPYFLPCGLFNSTDLWAFSGNLIVMNSECLKKALKIVNKIKIAFYYGWEDIDLFSLLFLNSQKIPILCKNEIDAKKVYRLTGEMPSIINDLNNFISIVGAK